MPATSCHPDCAMWSCCERPRRIWMRLCKGATRDLELRADDLRLAADRLGRISGAVDVEDLLDVIFSQFCIGK